MTITEATHIVEPDTTPDAFVFRAVSREDRHRLYAGLRRYAPDARWRMRGDGVVVPAWDLAATSLDVGDVRYSEASARMLSNRRRVASAFQRVRDSIRQIKANGEAAAKAALADNGDLAVLDDHQWVNVACMTVPDGFGLCVFDEQGAGKTVTAIFAYDTLVERDQVDAALIVAPKSMVSEWPNDFDRFTGSRYAVRLLAGSRKEKRTILSRGGDVLVTNFETLVLMEDELRGFLRRFGDRAVLIIDESFYVKNLDAKRTLAARRLREWCGRAFVLCGTPAPNSPVDVEQQFNLVDFGYAFAGANLPDEQDAARPVVSDVIHRRGLFIRHRKREVLPDLPTKSFNCVSVEMSPTQARLYADAVDGLIRDLRAIDDETYSRQIVNFLARRAALLQICSHPAGLVDGYKETPAKLRALDDLLDQFVGDMGEKMVVWSFFTRSIEAICTRFSRFNPARYDGTVADVAERREAVRRFQDDDHTMLLVANPAAAGAGLTLHRARLAVYESMSNQAAHYLQSLDRIHRRGQGRDVEYTVLLCQNTIEDAEYKRLRDKEQAAADLLGDPAEQVPARQVMLDQLLRSATAAERHTGSRGR